MQARKENGGGRNRAIGKGIYIRKLVNGAESCGLVLQRESQELELLIGGCKS